MPSAVLMQTQVNVFVIFYSFLHNTLGQGAFCFFIVELPDDFWETSKAPTSAGLTSFFTIFLFTVGAFSLCYFLPYCQIGVYCSFYIIIIMTLAIILGIIQCVYIQKPPHTCQPHYGCVEQRNHKMLDYVLYFLDSYRCNDEKQISSMMMIDKVNTPTTCK